MSPAGPAAAQDWLNPLRDVRDKRLPRIAGPSGLVLFGVTGDLARKKLMPAIYDLANRGLLPPGFALVGFARRDWEHQDFAEVVHDAIREHARTPFRSEVWDRLSEGLRFVQGSFDDDDAFDRLADTVRALDTGADPRPWLLASAAADAADAIGTLVAWKHLPSRGRLLTAAMASAATVIGLRAAQQTTNR